MSESAADIFAEVVDFPMPPFPYRAICFIIRYGTGNNICYSDVYTILVVPILPVRELPPGPEISGPILADLRFSGQWSCPLEVAGYLRRITPDTGLYRREPTL
jgi:hypothetical protein